MPKRLTSFHGQLLYVNYDHDVCQSFVTPWEVSEYLMELGWRCKVAARLEAAHLEAAPSKALCLEALGLETTQLEVTRLKEPLLGVLHEGRHGRGV